MADAPASSGARGRARDAILCAVIEIVAELGVDAVTHRRVAERAGVSPGSTTHHFTSREDLLASAMRHYLERADRLLLHVAEKARAHSDDPLERVRWFATQVIDEEFADERFIRAEHELLLYATADEELAAHVRAWDGRWVTTIASDLEAAGWPHALETARTIVNFMRGYEVERLLNPQLAIGEFRRRIDWLLSPRAADGTN